jgi:hypothetical protein
VIDDKHESENFIQLFRLVSILYAFEEGNEHIKFPIIIKTILFLINLINTNYIRRLEWTKTVLH